MQAIAHGYITPADREESDTLKATVTQYYDRNLCNRYRWGGVFIDAPSSRTQPFFDRFAADALCNRLERSDAVILSDLSSCFRGPGDRARVLEFFRSRRAVVHFVRESISTTDPTFADMLCVAIDSVRKADDEGRRQAILAKMDDLRRRGQPLNAERPLGFKWVGRKGSQKLVPDAEERTVMKRIFDLHWGGMPFSQIREHLLQEGIRYRYRVRGRWERRPWSESRCRRAYRAWQKLQEEEAIEPPVASADLLGA